MEDLLALVHADQRKYADPIRQSASPEALAALQGRVRELFGAELPADYAEFLQRSDGLDFNGLVVYDSASTPEQPSNGFWQGLVAVNQAWRDNPLVNFGWGLIGDETVQSAKRFHSGEDPQPLLRPKLVVSYAFSPPATRREEWLRQYFPLGQFVDDFADLDGDAMTTRIEYAMGYSPFAPNPPALTVTTNLEGTALIVTFRRDPRATDLTYRLQTSSDLVAWTVAVESIAGAVPTGPALVSDNVIAPEAPLRLVTAQPPLVPGDNRAFARLVVLR